MAKTIENLFIYIAIYSSILPIGYYLLSLKKIWNLQLLRIVLLYAVVEFVTNFLTLFLEIHQTIILYSFFTLVEYGLLAWIFFEMIKSKPFKKWILVLSGLYVIFWTLYKMVGNYSVLDSVPIGIESILVMIYIFYFFYQEMDNVSGTFLYNRFSFWIASGILIYLAGSFFLNVLANQVDSPTRHAYWMFANMCTTVKNIFFFTSLLLLTRRKGFTPIFKENQYVL